MFRDADGNVIRHEDGTPVGSIDVSELPGAAGEEDVSKLKKAELVELAQARGIDTDGLLKDELIAALEGGNDEEEIADGDDGVS